jgi:hypothetical protein
MRPMKSLQMPEPGSLEDQTAAIQKLTVMYLGNMSVRFKYDFAQK